MRISCNLDTVRRTQSAALIRHTALPAPGQPRGNQFDIAIVELVYQIHKAPRSVLVPVQQGNLLNQNGVVLTAIST